VCGNVQKLSMPVGQTTLRTRQVSMHLHLHNGKCPSLAQFYCLLCWTPRRTYAGLAMSQPGPAQSSEA
jgi:hypothetical protein